MNDDNLETVLDILERCIGYSGDPLGWRLALVEQLSGAVAAPIVMTTEARAAWDPDRAEVLFHVDHGWTSDDQRACFIRYQVEGANRTDPMRLALASRRDEIVVGAASAMLDFDRYRASAVFERYMKPAGVGDMLTAVSAIGPAEADHWNIVSCVRLESDPPFGEREAALLSTLARLLRSRIGLSLADSSSPVCGLTTRLRSALALLMEGLSEAEAAETMGIRPSTFHGYVQELYRTFGVTSRPKLQALFYGLGRIWTDLQAHDDPRLRRLKRESVPMTGPWRAADSIVRRS